MGPDTIVRSVAGMFGQEPPVSRPAKKTVTQKDLDCLLQAEKRRAIRRAKRAKHAFGG